jgi:pyrroline-5-carboxylate reductase
MSTIGFLGGGRITSAILEGLHLGDFHPRIVVHDRNPEKLRYLRRNLGARTVDFAPSLLQTDLLVLAIRPQSAAQALKSLAPIEHHLAALSLCAGISLGRLETLLPYPVRWARAMPSPACASGHGLTAIALSSHFPARANNLIWRMFGAIGEIIFVPERELDAFTIAFSPTHGQHALATLAEAAQMLGLNRDLALLAAAHALGDSISDWRARNAPPIAGLLHDAATPGGIAAEVIKSMKRAGYQRMMTNGLKAGMKRVRELSKL